MKLTVLKVIVVMHLFLFEYCLSFEHNRTKRMNNGVDTFFGEFKHVVAIFDIQELAGTGGILDKYHILTAAHFFIDRVTNEFIRNHYTVCAGTNDLRLADPPRILIAVERIYIPDYFNRRDFNTYGDIAVLKLRTPLDLSDTSRLQPLTLMKINYCINERNEYKDQETVTAGFGGQITNRKFFSTDKLFKLHVKILDSSICYNRYRFRNPHVICGTVINPYDAIPRGVCFGDSGAPLMNENGEVIAIVRGGIGLCDQNVKPAAYTKVIPYLDFIRNAMAGQIIRMRVAN